MSDETKRKLDEATTVVVTARAKTDARKQECLDGVADGIPGAVDRLAKRTAQAQADVTKGLGAAGVRALREELAAEAAELAEFVRTGVERVAWPRRDSEWSKVEPRQVHSALFKLMYGTPVNRVGNVFGRHGFDVRRIERDGGAQGLVLPQYLYDEDSFGPVAEALTEVGTAEIALKRAKATDDSDVVDTLWDEA